MKKQHILSYLLIFLMLFFLQDTSAVLFGPNTLDDTLIRSNGLNTTINVSNFTVTFDTLEITSTYINFTNLVYVNPRSCGLRQSYYPIYTYTTPNQIFELPYETECLPPSGGAVDTGAGGGGTWDAYSNITLDSINITTEKFYFNEKAYIYILPLDKYGNAVNLSNLSVFLIDNITYTEEDIIKTADFVYKKGFTINKLDIINFKVRVVAVQDSKIITKEVFILISEKDNIIKDINDIFNNKKIIYILLWGIFLLVILISIIMVFLKRQRSKNR